MKHKIILLFLLLFASVLALTSQSCTPYQQGMLTRQGQVDSFKINYPGCTVIEGSMTLTRNVENLDSLHLITKVKGNLFMNYSKLVNLNGLTSLDSTG